MANQFYYQIIDNTLYYGANEWEGSTLMTPSTSAYMFNFDNSVLNLLPKDESVVVLENVVKPIFYFNNSNLQTIDLTHFTIKGDFNLFYGSNSYSNSLNEIGLPDGIENCTFL